MNMATRIEAARIMRELRARQQGDEAVIAAILAEEAALAAEYAAQPPAQRRTWRVYADGSDDYTGEDDLTERAIENANDAWASGQTALDEGWGR